MPVAAKLASPMLPEVKKIGGDGDTTKMVLKHKKKREKKKRKFESNF